VQLLSLIPKEIFKEVTKQEGADKYYKKFKSTDHFIAFFLFGADPKRQFEIRL